MSFVITLFPSNLHWPTFDKSWPLKRQAKPNRNVAFAATNHSLEHFDMGYQGCSSFQYFDFPMSSAMQVSVPVRQAEFLAGRLCAHQLLFDFAVHHDYLASDTEQNPIWPKSIVGSIAHSFPYSLAMIANAKDYLSIGLAMEAIISPELADNLGQSVLTPDERQNLDTPLDETVLSLIYCLKQSVFKALFSQCHHPLYFEDVRVTNIDWDKGEAHLCLNRDVSKAWQKGEMLKAQFDFYHTKVIALTLLSKSNYRVLIGD